MADDEQEFTHPSYGMVSFTRFTSTGYRMFGSAVKVNGGVTLCVKRAIRAHTLHHDWYRGREQLIEVHLTELQFAQLLTGMNVGDGVPCTINFVAGEGRVEDPPADVLTEAEIVHKDVKEKSRDLGRQLDKAAADIRKVLAESKVAKGEKEKVLHAVDMFVQEVRHNLPYLMEQFQQSAERVVSELKTEVVAFCERTLRSRGLEALGKQAPTPLLPGGKDDGQRG